jgi:phosphatidylglycerol---prolipoprotein diacylglyceryl transferase
MHPVLFSIGTFEVHTYGFLGAVAFLSIAGVAITRGKRLGIAAERISDLIFWTAILSLAGSRALFVLQNPSAVSGFAEWFNLRGGGLVFYGALLTGVPVGSMLMLRSKMPYLATWDIFATAFPLGHALTRLGCFAAGCCHGSPTDVSWAVTFTNTRSVAPLNTALHPTQLYEAAALFSIGLICNLVYWKKRFDGQVIGTYLMLYAIGRSVVEEFRGDVTRGYFAKAFLGETLSYSQGVSIGVFLAGALVLGIGWKRSKDGMAMASKP